jgi:CheY-like chemotaxis protein/HPt (histidine-containing phosphotransfer) domain-containing protein
MQETIDPTPRILFIDKPPADPKCPPARASAPVATLPTRRHLRVLVAEDNPINRIIAVKTLEKLGHVAVSVENGCEAVNALQCMPYDAVLMDCQMPVMDGFEATRIIRDPISLVLDHGTPIIALTAHAMRGDRERCLEAGMNDYLTKPFAPAHLAATLERWSFRSPQKSDEVSAPPSAPRFVPELDAQGGPDFDREGFLERTQGDRDLAREIAEMFLADAPPILIQLTDAIAAGDADAAGKLAHNLKGASANMGGEKFSRITAQLQAAGNAGHLDPLRELLPAARSAFQALLSHLEREFCLSRDPG